MCLSDRFFFLTRVKIQVSFYQRIVRLSFSRQLSVKFYNSTFPQQRLCDIQRRFIKSKYPRFSSKFSFFEVIRQQRYGHQGLWLVDAFSTSPLHQMHRILPKLTRGKYSSKVFYLVLRFSSKYVILNSGIGLLWSINVLFFLCNWCTMLDETIQEASTQYHLLKLCFWLDTSAMNLYWPTHFRLPYNDSIIRRNMQESSTQGSLQG